MLNRLQPARKVFKLSGVISKTQALIETVTQDNAAKAILEESLIKNHPAAAETLTHLEATGKQKGGAWRSAVLWILALVALGATVYPTFSALRLVMDRMELSPHAPVGLTAQERLLFKDPAQDPLEQKRLLHLSDPQNPAFFAEYLQQWRNLNDDLPPDALETAARIAPGNALFLYLAAADAGENAIEELPANKPFEKSRMIDGVRLPPLPRETEYRITDQKAYEKAIALMMQAAALPKIESYTNAMIAARCRLLPTRNMAEFMNSLQHAYGTPTPLISLMTIRKLFNARAEELSKNGHVEEFRNLAMQRNAFINGLNRNPDIHLVGELVNQSITMYTAAQFHAAAERLGLADLEATYRQQRDALQHDYDRRRIQSKTSGGRGDRRHSTMGGLSIPVIQSQVITPPPLQDSDLKPHRMAEHKWVTGIGVLYTATLILLIAVGIFLFRFLLRRKIRLPAKRLATVISPTDWCWVLILGIALPIVLFLIITQLTPLAGTDYGSMHFLYTFPGVHFIALSLGLLIDPAMLMRWRLARKLAPFGFTPHKRTRNIAVIICLLVPSLTAYPVLVHLDFSITSLCALAVPLALVLGLALSDALRCHFGKPIERIFKSTTAIAVLPAYAVAIIALCSLLPIYHAAEKHWIAQETLFRINPDATDLGTYEGKIATQKRRETQTMIGLK